MKFLYRYAGALLLIIALTAVFSCSAKQEISMDFNGEGTGAMEIVLHPVLTSYLSDLTMAVSNTDNPEKLPIFDEVGIWNGFAKSDSIELLSVEIPERERLVMKWRFEDLNEPFREYPGDEIPVLSFEKSGDTRTLRFYLAPENFHQVSGYFPLFDEEMFDYFGPNPEDPVPEDIYIEDLEFAMEDYLIDQSMSEVLEDTVISFMIKTGGRIISHEGGTVVEDGAVFDVPLVKFLTLNEPVSWSLVFTEE